MDFMFWVWLGIIVVSAVIEFITMDMTSIWFTAGAALPFILSAIGGIHWAIQVAIFVVLTCVFIFALRPLAKKYLLRNANTRTNTEALIGKECRLLTGCDFENLGSLKINGVVWSVKAQNDEKLEKNEIVKIVEIDGNKLVVKQVNKED